MSASRQAAAVATGRRCGDRRQLGCLPAARFHPALVDKHDIPHTTKWTKRTLGTEPYQAGGSFRMKKGRRQTEPPFGIKKGTVRIKKEPFQVLGVHIARGSVTSCMGKGQPPLPPVKQGGGCLALANNPAGTHMPCGDESRPVNDCTGCLVKGCPGQGLDTGGGGGSVMIAITLAPALSPRSTLTRWKAGSVRSGPRVLRSTS